MPRQKNNAPNAMKNLTSDVKEKAIDIANRLVEDGYEDERAIAVAISEAKTWYDNRGGTIRQDITHYLKPRNTQWVIIRKDASRASFVFNTKEEALDKIKTMMKKSPIKTLVFKEDGSFDQTL